MSLYKRTGAMFDWVVDRHANNPGNDEHTQAAFRELYGMYLQGFAQGGFRQELAETLPVYPAGGSESEIAKWEEEIKRWESTLTEDEEKRMRFEVTVTWESVSNDPEIDKLRSQAKYQKQCETLDRLGIRPDSGFFGKDLGE